jgi:ABC-type Fe3+ transport system permease subunit
MLAKRIVRYLCLNRNPLRRRFDVIEAWLTVIFAAVLLAGPFVARNVGNAMYWNQLSKTDAVLHDPFPAEPVPAGTSIVHDVADQSTRHVWAMWDGVVAGVIAMLGLTAVALGLWWVARRSLDRRRAAAWKAAWGLIEAEWSGRW